jgi:hypothetical protein
MSQRFGIIATLLTLATGSLPALSAAEDARKLAGIFEQQVTRRLDVPADEQEQYGQLLSSTLADAGILRLPPEFVVLVDRSPRVQAAMIFWKSPDGPFEFIGGTSVSTGLPGRYEHFETPLGVYDHVLDNLDFRSEGTLNEFGIRGYGEQGMRVFDFGWVKSPKGWGNHALSELRLQLHATDPDVLEPRLGTAQSKGCIRTTASFNRFLDRYGILDGNYERAMTAGHKLWMLSPLREPTAWSGRYLVVVETQRRERPAWARSAPSPRSHRRTDSD